MLRISRADTTDPNECLVRLEGDVRGRWVDELRRACDDACNANGNPPRRLVLDFSGVLFIDSSGVALFHELAMRQVRFTNCSPFVAEQLRQAADDCH